MKRVLLVGERYSTNLGDGVIYQTVERMIRANFPDASIYGLDLSGRVTYSDDVDWLQTSFDAMLAKYLSADVARARLVRRQLRAILDKRPVDAIVFVGGQLLMDYFVRPMAAVVNEAERRGIPVIYNACGFGKTSQRDHRNIRTLLENNTVVAVSLRDGTNEGVLGRLTNGVVPVLTTDPVLELAAYWPEMRRRKRSKIGRVGINIMSPWTTHRSHPEAGNAYTKQLLTAIIEFCEKQGLSWQIYSNGASEDVAYISGACRELGIAPQAIAPPPQTPEQLVAQIASYDMIVGFRMHTHIIAHALAIPTVGLIWDEKIACYAEQTGQIKQFLAINSSPEEVCQSMKHTLKHRQAASARPPRDRTPNSQFLCDSLKPLL